MWSIGEAVDHDGGRTLYSPTPDALRRWSEDYGCDRRFESAVRWRIVIVHEDRSSRATFRRGLISSELVTVIIDAASCHSAVVDLPCN